MITAALISQSVYGKKWQTRIIVGDKWRVAAHNGPK